MLRYNIQDDETLSFDRVPGTTDPTAGKMRMNVVFTDQNDDDSDPTYMEFDTLDPVIIDSQLRSAAIDYNAKVLAAAESSGFDSPIDDLTVGSDVEFNDDGTAGTGSITGVVWRDNDQDGIRDDVARIVGSAVELRMAIDDSVVDTVNTDANGIYTFTEVENGAYYLHFATPSGHAATLKDQGGDDTLDSDIDPMTGDTDNFNVASGEAITGYDAGFYQLATISGTVWTDLDKDGIFDGGESGHASIDVELRAASGNTLIDTVTTDINGDYEFTDINPDVYYVKIPTLPAGYVLTLQDQGSDDTVDSDFDVATNKTANIPLTPGEAITDVNAGIYLNTRIINGSIFDDWDRDGVWDAPGETISSISTTVEIRAYPTNSLVDSTVTTSGTYEFNVGYDGDFYVKVIPTTYWERSPGGTDSDVDQTTGESDFFHIEGGDTVTINAGIMHERGYVDAHVFIDDGAGGGTPDDGIQNGTEANSDGTEVYLRVTNPQGGFWDSYPDPVTGDIHLLVHTGINLTAAWTFVGGFATGYHISGAASNPETGITVTNGGTTDLGDRGVAAD